MLATQIRQKDSVFYFVCVPGRGPARQGPVHQPLLRRRRADRCRARSRKTTTSRSSSRRSSAATAAFQRELVARQGRRDQELLRDRGRASRRSRARCCCSRAERLKFDPVKRVRQRRQPGGAARQVPDHRRPAPARRAALLHAASAPTTRATIHVPCVIFDGKSEDFATEMFVIINSTPTRINKSHLVDLYEKVSWAAPDKQVRRAASSSMLYARATARCATRSTASAAAASRRSGSCRPSCSTRSTAGCCADWKKMQKQATSRQREATRYYEMVRDFLKAAEKVWGDAWGNAQLHGHQAGHAQGDAARVRRPRRASTPSRSTAA